VCGIAGILSRERDFALPEDWIEKMMAVQAHRGPDDAHWVRFPGCLLGFDRLSVQDISPLGRQPMSVEGSPAGLVFNGEIYNFVELAAEHRSRGVRFRSRSDSEVLLHHYLSRGEACLDALNGMFAFAVYDPESEILFAARDRFGVKPFYYYLDDSYFCFASEIKALLTLPFVPRAPNLDILFAGALGRGNDRWEGTCFGGILQLLPSHRLRIHRRIWAPETRKYWAIRPPENISSPSPGSDSTELEAEFRNLFHSAVSLRLRSDRPVGLLLSGGVDSSTIAAAMARILRAGGDGGSAAPPRLFTMSLPGEAMDESVLAQETARSLGLSCRLIKSLEPDLERLVPATLWHNEEPLPYLNRCIHWQMMKEIAEDGIIVVLNGQGGDEIMGGYVGRLLGGTLATALKNEGWAGFAAEWKCARDLRGYRFRWMLSQLPKPFLAHRWVRSFQALVRERGLSLATLRFIHHGVLRDHSPRLVSGDFVNDQLLKWLTRDTVPDLCHYEDRNSAAHGLEERFPFLDYRIAEFMFRLPWSFKVYRGISKVLIRHAMRGWVPDAVLDRHQKIGMEVPEDKWVRGPLSHLIQDVAASKSFRERGLWRAGPVRALIEDHLAGRVNRGNLIWRITGTELWFRMFLDGTDRPGIQASRIQTTQKGFSAAFR